MNPTNHGPVILSGARGPLDEHLARELSASPASGRRLVFVCGPEGCGPAEVAAAARVAESAASLSHVCFVAAEPAATAGRVAEDALRYLAASLGAPFAAVRAPAADFAGGEGSRRLAALAAAASAERLEGERRAPPPPRVVLVTGAAGQLGRALSTLLDAHGIGHRGLDVAPPPPGSTAPYLRTDLSASGGEAVLREFCAPVTHVVHLAGRITNAKSLSECYREQHALNVEGTLRLLEALSPGLRHFAYASSMTVYGNRQNAPYVDEHAPVEPNCVYALMKVAVERHLADFARRTGAKVALLRYTSAYGPGPASGRAIPAMIARLLEGRPPELHGDGGARRDYIYVDDLCRATLEASLREYDGVLNVGTGVGVSAGELAELLVRLTGSPLKPVYSGRPVDAQGASSLVYDIGRMRRELGFEPEVSLEEGLRRTIAHFKAAASAAQGHGQRQAAGAGEAQLKT